MATIPPFVAKGTAVGQKQTVKTKKLVWIPVGQGQVTAYSDYEIRVKGQIDILIYKGDLSIYLRLTDEQPTARRGVSVLQLNSYRDEQATYQVQKNTLTVTAVLGGKQQSISILPCNGGSQTECKLFGWINETIHLEPR